ncbi:MAG TPA: GtrA family protein [Bryobacteraceae bacterium]|nr:GtrA family protein [Bryobacteraceae bacterium]
MFRRWLKFNLVGVLGAIVQLAVLEALTRGLKLQYLWATAMAVETALLHNFIWHEVFTWRGVGLAESLGQRLWRLVRFNLANGMVSLLGNLLLMWVFAGLFKWPYLIANLVAICACALLNFYLSERHIFVKTLERAPKVRPGG